ncbi:MAG: hypothetical protein LBH12_04460, partial [Dysgonamonadaceae bacterium]|nr:hypothetical protein [Dysgonamonadaceae bacterium]
RHDSGDVRSTGDIGHYWSSVVDGTNSYSMNFYSSRVSANGYGNRAYGMSVRCVAELVKN